MIDEVLEQKLDDLITSDFEAIESYEVGTKERESLKEEVVDLYKLKTESYKVQAAAFNEAERDRQNMDMKVEELELRNEQLRSEKHKSIHEYIITGVKVAAILGITVLAMVVDSDKIINSRVVRNIPTIKL